MIGTFPPPLHGMASVNLSVFNILNEEGIKVVRFNISPSTLERSFAYHARKISRVLVCIFSYLFNIFNNAVTYIGLSGGSGQLYDICFVFLARIKGEKLLIHHHSFAYLNTRSAITSTLIRIAGRHAIHIVLCKSMKNKFIKMYGENLKIVVMSNFIFLPPEKINGEKLRDVKHAIKIGFISNISYKKGIIDFLAVVHKLKESGASIEAYLAGPFESEDVEKFIKKNLRDYKFLNYCGSVYNKEKESFFNKIDVLLFPTKYENEAAPLVVFEALSYGIPVISTQRGCIADMLLDSGSPAISEDRFIEDSVDRIHEWIENSREYINCSMKSIRVCREMSNNINREKKSFLELFQ